jgi:hypothetical protein
VLSVAKPHGKKIGYFAFADQQGADTAVFAFVYKQLDLPVQAFEALNRKPKPRGVNTRRRCNSSHASTLAAVGE